MTHFPHRRLRSMLALGLLLSACAYTPATGCGATASSSPALSQALSGPVAVRTTLPAPPTPPPTPTPSPPPTPTPDPFKGLFAQGFALDQPQTLPGDPSRSPYHIDWALAPGQADKATLSGNTLHALKPGGILLVGHADARVAYLFLAAYEPGVSTYPFSSNSAWQGVGKLDGARIINSSTEWNGYYQSLYSAPSLPNQPISPPPLPSTPPIDFSQHSLLLYEGPIGPNDDQIWVTDVTANAIHLVVTGTLAQGEPHSSYQNLQLAELIPKVPSDATVSVERMPPEVVPSATPFPANTSSLAFRLFR